MLYLQSVITLAFNHERICSQLDIFIHLSIINYFRLFVELCIMLILEMCSKVFRSHKQQPSSESLNILQVQDLHLIPVQHRVLKAYHNNNCELGISGTDFSKLGQGGQDSSIPCQSLGTVISYGLLDHENLGSPCEIRTEQCSKKKRSQNLISCDLRSDTLQQEKPSLKCFKYSSFMCKANCGLQ